MPRTAKKPINAAFNTGHPAAAAIAPGLPYGQRQALEQSLAQAPIPPSTAGQVSQAAGPGNLMGGGGPPQITPQQEADAQSTPFSPVGLFDQSQQPGTPVTAGLPSGPGPGPEALVPPPNPDAQALSSLVPLLEVLASGPDSTYATRNFLRTVRSSQGQ